MKRRGKRASVCWLAPYGREFHRGGSQAPAGENLVAVAKVQIRLGQSADLLGQYRDHPDSYPVSKARMDYLHFDGNPGFGKLYLFDSNQAFIEREADNPDNPGFHPSSVANRIRKYEDAGWDVVGVFVYREEWIYDLDVHSPFPDVG